MTCTFHQINYQPAAGTASQCSARRWWKMREPYPRMTMRVKQPRHACTNMDPGFGGAESMRGRRQHAHTLFSTRRRSEEMGAMFVKARSSRTCMEGDSDALIVARMGDGFKWMIWIGVFLLQLQVSGSCSLLDIRHAAVGYTSSRQQVCNRSRGVLYLLSRHHQSPSCTAWRLWLRGGKGEEEGEEEDVVAWQMSHGDPHTGTGRRILAKRLRRACIKGVVSEIEAAISDGADVKAVDLAGFTMLHLAAEGGHDEAVSLLLSKGADPNGKEGLSGRTALHTAAVCGVPLVIDLGGGEVEACDDAGRTPLAIAAWEGTAAAVEALLCHSALVTTCDRYGQTPAGLAQLSPMIVDEAKRKHILEMLRSRADLGTQVRGDQETRQDFVVSDLHAIE